MSGVLYHIACIYKTLLWNSVPNDLWALQVMFSAARNYKTDKYYLKKDLNDYILKKAYKGLLSMWKYTQYLNHQRNTKHWDTS